MELQNGDGSDDVIENEHVVSQSVTNDIRRIDWMEFVSCNNVAMLSFTRLSNDSLDDRKDIGGEVFVWDMFEDVDDVTRGNEGYHSCLDTIWVCIYNW